MTLNLQNAIAFFDLETTGTDIVTDRIVEIAILKIEPDQSSTTFNIRVNPTIPIPDEASKVHGIYQADIENSLTFKQIASKVHEFIDGCDLAGFNSNRFDIPLLAEEFLRAGIEFSIKNINVVDVQVLYHQNEKRTLVAAYDFYCKKDLTNAHSALADTTATYEVLKAQLDKYDHLENNISELSKLSSNQDIVDFAGKLRYNIKNQIVFTFGKNKDIPVKTVNAQNPSYISWLLSTDFPLYTKHIIRKEIQ